MSERAVCEPIASRPRMPATYGILPENEGGGLLPWSWARERLERARNYFFSTVRPDGRPHVAPIWGCWMDERFLFSTDRASVKAKNLAQNPRCVVCPENGVESIMVEGVAREMTDRAILERYIALYDPKYSWTSDLAAGPFYEVEPRVVFAFIEGPGTFAGRSTRWAFSKG
jgi:hypothetical protein